jgi:hypothetical protein
MTTLLGNDHMFKKQLKDLTDVILKIRECECYSAIELIAARRDALVQAVNDPYGRNVVEGIEPYLEQFYVLSCEEQIFSEAVLTLEPHISDEKVLPSVVSATEILAVFADVGSERDRILEALTSNSGSVVNDYLQGDPLTMIENVANACVRFNIVSDHVNEMSMLLG